MCSSGDRWLLRETQRWCLARPDDEGFACGVDDVLGDARQLVDLDEAVDLGEEALDKTEVPARDAGHGGQGPGSSNSPDGDRSPKLC